MTDTETDHWFDDRREAVRYMIAQVVQAGSLAGLFLSIPLLGRLDAPAAARVTIWVLFGIGLFGFAGSAWVISRSVSYPRTKWGEAREDDTKTGQQIAWLGSRMLFKDAAQVAGWGRGWVLARDLLWTAVVVVLVAEAIIGGVSIST